jgi:hypothetical protein
MNSTFKAPGSKGLTLKGNDLLSNLLQICFQIQLAPVHHGGEGDGDADGGLA